MAKKGLREQLIGAWKLVSYVETPVDGSPKRFPMDENAQGNQPVYLDARADRRAHIGAVCGPSSRAALRKHENLSVLRERVGSGAQALRCLAWDHGSRPVSALGRVHPQALQVVSTVRTRRSQGAVSILTQEVSHAGAFSDIVGAR